VAAALGSAKDARDSGYSHPAMALVTIQVFPDARCSRRERGDVVRHLDPGTAETARTIALIAS
jgi:hypothetical protein